MKYIEDFLVIITMFCIGSSIIYIRSIEYYENYIFFTSILIIFGLISGYIIYFLTSYLNSNLKKIEIINGNGYKTMILVSFIFLSLGLGTLINNHYSQYSEIKEYELIKKSTNNNKSTTFYFYISNDLINEKRLPVNFKTYNYYNEGETISIERTKGVLGGIYFGKISEN